nr:hypothetical protein CFP56_22458 [Quercus suber]
MFYCKYWTVFATSQMGHVIGLARTRSYARVSWIRVPIWLRHVTGVARLPRPGLGRAWHASYDCHLHVRVQYPGYIPTRDPGDISHNQRQLHLVGDSTCMHLVASVWRPPFRPGLRRDASGARAAPQPLWTQDEGCAAVEAIANPQCRSLQQPCRWISKAAMANVQQSAMHKPGHQEIVGNDGDSIHDAHSMLEVTQNVFDTNDEGL